MTYNFFYYIRLTKLKYSLLLNNTGTEEEKVIIRRFLADSTAKSVTRMKRKICEIVEKEKDIKFDYELLIENCNNMYDILNDISEMYKPEENNTTM